jgi:hypothetical protein
MDEPTLLRDGKPRVVPDTPHPGCPFVEDGELMARVVEPKAAPPNWVAIGGLIIATVNLLALLGGAFFLVGEWSSDRKYTSASIVAIRDDLKLEDSKVNGLDVRVSKLEAVHTFGKAPVAGTVRLFPMVPKWPPVQVDTIGPPVPVPPLSASILFTRPLPQQTTGKR